MPKSPNASFVPPLAAPVRLGWCCLRCLTLRGINMVSALLSALGRRSSGDGSLGDGRRSLGAVRTRRALRTGATRTAGGAVATATATAARSAGTRRGLGLALGTGAGDLALVDPDLHADAAEGRAR